MTVQRRKGKKLPPPKSHAERAAMTPAERTPPKVEPPPLPQRKLRTRFCEEICATILRWLEAGNFRESACARARVDPHTLVAWLDRGRAELEKTPEGEELSEYATFYVDVVTAEATAETVLVGQILEGEPEDKRWFLERRYPRRFGRMATRVELTGAEGKPIEVQDARRTLLGRLLAVAGPGPDQADDPGAEPG